MLAFVGAFQMIVAVGFLRPSPCNWGFQRRAEAAFVELSQAAEELGDIPDRFMCPIGCDIMRDPVTLPTSGQVGCSLFLEMGGPRLGWGACAAFDLRFET